MTVGILLYGYDAEKAETIRRSISAHTGLEVDLLSASGMRKSRICDILDAPAGHFEESRVKVLMLLGFTGELIHKAVAGFPTGKLNLLDGHGPGEIERPLFCVLTKANAEWTFEYLVAHLFEERKSFVGERSGGSEPADSA